jgi:DNA-binding transcriptional LysR family regulator
MSRRDAEAATWIAPSEGSATRAAVEAAWADLGITASHRLELPSWEAVKLAAARGYGVAGCSEYTVDGELRAGTLGLVRLRGWKVAADDLDRAAPGRRAHAIGARIRGHVACAMAPPTAAAT